MPKEFKALYKEVNPYSGQYLEDAPANSAGGGGVAGIGVGPDGEPGIDPKKKKKRYLDARTKEYRFHRAKLEARRLKRANKNGTI